MKKATPTKVRVVEPDGRVYTLSNVFESRAQARAQIKRWKRAQLFEGCALTPVPA